MNEFKILTLGQKHLSQWIQARQELWPENNPSLHEQEIKRLTSTDEFQAWGAFEGETLVGFLELYVRPFANGCRSMPVPFLEGIWVAEEIRKNGVGTALLKCAESWARGAGYTEMGSDALVENALSHEAHQSWGFAETERVVYFKKDL